MHPRLLVIVSSLFACTYWLKPHASSRFDPQTGLLTGTNDGTLVNFFLRNLGRESENTLCVYLLVFQVLFFPLSAFYYSFPNFVYASQVELIFCLSLDRLWHAVSVSC